MRISEIVAIIIVVMLLYWLSTNEDDMQPTITAQSKCELALRNQHYFPKYIIEECKKQLKEPDDD